MSLYNGILFAAPPPNGMTPNIDAPYDATSLIGITAVFFPLAVLSLCIRVYTRAAIVGKVSVDDYLMIGAIIFSVLMTAFVMNMLNYGLGKHLWDVPMTPDLYPKFMLNNLLAAIFFCTATGLAKGSILLFYLRIFPSRALHYTVWGVFAFTQGYSLASVLVNIFSCNPVQASWQFEFVETATCINRPAFYFAQATLGIVTDIATVVVPLPLLKTLHLPWKQKIAVGVVLTMGAFVCIVSIVRLQSLYVLLTDNDLTKNTVVALMWCILELNLSILGGSIPTFKPFLQRLFPRFLGSSAHVSSNGNYPRSSRNQRSGRRKSSQALASPYRSATSGSRDLSHLGNGDSGSEEYIMQDHVDQANITKTVQYGFDFHNADEGRNTRHMHITPKGI